MNKPIIIATKEFTWDCAHMLDGHEGLCKNLHGHTYKLLVTAAPRDGCLVSEGPGKGMVCDFKELKSFVQRTIVEPLDHATIINMSSADPFEKDLYILLSKYDKKIFKMHTRPTAENMAQYFLCLMNNTLFAEHAAYRIPTITLYETPTSYVECFYQKED